MKHIGLVNKKTKEIIILLSNYYITIQIHLFYANTMEITYIYVPNAKEHEQLFIVNLIMFLYKITLHIFTSLILSINCVI